MVKWRSIAAALFNHYVRSRQNAFTETFLTQGREIGPIAGGEDDPSGTIRAITAPRSRSSTALPAGSQAFRRLVSRSCLILMLGIHDCATTRDTSPNGSN